MEASAQPQVVPPRLKERYEQEIAPSLQERFGYGSAMEIPRLEKITLNMGVGDAKQDSNVLDAASEQLATIAGQAPNVRRAKKSIANFKLRDGMPVGVSVTLRRAYMWEFLDRLTSIAIPRIRDFRGLNPRSFDGRGNWTLGIREQIIFPEIDYDSIDQVRGLDVAITTSARRTRRHTSFCESWGCRSRRRARRAPTSPTRIRKRRPAWRRLVPRLRPRPPLSTVEGREPGGVRDADSPGRGRGGRGRRRSRAPERHRSRWQRLHRRSATARSKYKTRNYKRASAAVARARTCASSACAGSASARSSTRA